MSTPAGAAAIVAGAFQSAPDGTLIFPPLPGLDFGFAMRPTFSTIVQEAPDRSKSTIQLDPYPRWEYDLSFGHLSDDPAQGVLKISPQNPMNETALYQLFGLFCAVGGQRSTFFMKMSDLTKRLSDSHMRNLQIGTGDGATTSFQLVRSVGGFLDLIENPLNLIVQVQSPGTAPTVVSPSSVVNGLVTLTTAPVSGAVITATFDWVHRMRFVNDSDEASAVWFQMYSHGTLKVVGERNEAA